MVHHALMIPTQRLPASLTPLDVALATLLNNLEPVAPRELWTAEALGCVASEMPPLQAVPPCDVAAADGWALRARDLVGASSYSPLPLALSPTWVEAGDAMPEGCDCVVDASCIDQTGPIAEALVEAIPGQGVRRIGGDIAEGRSVVPSGQRIGRVDLLSARVAGLKSIRVRHPRLRLVDIPANSSLSHTALLICELAGAAGASPAWAEASGRDAASIAKVIEPGDCDLLVTIGGSGVGYTDAAIAALVQCGADIAHGIALQPGRTAAVGRIGKIPVVALPGAPDQALAAWWTLVLPVLDRLSGLLQRQSFTLPLSRKIASSVGLAEIVLLKESAGAWTPLAVGELSLDLVARADAWLVVPGASEGFAAGTPVNAYLLRDLI
ncbi:Molybdopterin biosynthesis enzyme [Bradyrhizobium lablabi]|uniref:Molybdopterin molybdenumtransferase n=2 Tax=Bradyrhizobium lablabi TaxID=722472 RepID=A0A1M6PQC0_9BRAD|nr:Molybdopterin biosynthesis enzyme [Bradyrhizobium lablabi]